MPQGYLPPLVIRALLLMLMLVAVGAPAAPTPTPATPLVEARWFAIFEQSYGSEGLYVVESRPTDPGATARLDLQKLNSALVDWQLRHPGKPLPSATQLATLAQLTEIPADRLAKYKHDAALDLFKSTAGPAESPSFSVVQLLRGNEQIRRRLLEPDAYTRDRWKKIYTDPEAPQVLKNEILLREFLIENSNFPEVLLYERTQRQLAQINQAVTFYALSQGLKPGETVTFAQLRDSGMFKPLGVVPDNVEFTLTKIGEKARGTINGVPVADDASGPAAVRRTRANQLLAKHPDFPPAMVLAARFQKPNESLATLAKAVAKWPDVPGIRVERLAQLARTGNFNQWTEDLDFLLKRFPAAPLLIEIESAGAYGRLSRSSNAEASMVLILADVRPDLLTHQLMSIKLLEEVNRVSDAQTVYDRLIYANPSWKTVIDRPGDAKKPATQ